MIEVSGLCVEYRAIGGVVRAVNRLDLTVRAGEVLGLVGEGSSGKSSAALAILGLTRRGGHIAAGSVRFMGRELLTLDEREWRAIRGSQIALVPQNPRGALSPVQRIGEQLCAVVRSHAEVSRAEAVERALHYLRLVGINDPERRMDAFPHELSGGMAQRVVIAMALLCEPRALLADEPTSGLDVTVQAQVLDDLRRATEETGSSLLLITQDLGIVANYCDRVSLMHAGEVVEEAPTRTFFDEPTHPASVALLAAQRRIHEPGLRLHGLPVDGRRLGGGCWLAERCAFAEEEAGCTARHPELGELGPSHRSRCHRAQLVRDVAGAAFAAHDRQLRESGGRAEEKETV